MNKQTVTICTTIQYPSNKRLHMKFEENWPRGFREVIQRCQRTEDDRQSTDELVITDSK